MAVATFIAPFDPVVSAASVPLDKEGNPLPLLANWHITPISGKTVVVKIKAEDAVMTLIKADPLFQWLEDFEEAKDAG